MEYLASLASEDLEPQERARFYARVALELLDRARVEVDAGKPCAAAEIVWAAASLAVRAYAEVFDGRRLDSRVELDRYAAELARSLGEWIREAWMSVSDMPTYFYEGWCVGERVEQACRYARRLVEELAGRVLGGDHAGRGAKLRVSREE